jgi:hypothetical protein
MIQDSAVGVAARAPITGSRPQTIKTSEVLLQLPELQGCPMSPINQHYEQSRRDRLRRCWRA